MDEEERVSARKLEKQGTFPPKIVLRLTPPSKKLWGGNTPGVPDFGTKPQLTGAFEAAALVIAHAPRFPALGPTPHSPVRMFPARTGPPFTPPCHLYAWMVGTRPPPSKFTSRRRSPSTWLATCPGAGPKVPLGCGATFSWKNQRPSWASPLLSK